MANPWDNDPIVSKEAAGNPWDADPIVSKAAPKAAVIPAVPDPSIGEFVGDLGRRFINMELRNGRNMIAGVARGSGTIGNAILYPWDKGRDLYYGDREQNLESLIAENKPLTRHQERAASMDWSLGDMGAETESLPYKVGKLGAEIAGTAGMGGLLVNGARVAIPTVMAGTRATQLGNAVASAGFRTGAPVAETWLGRAADMGIRSAGGAINGVATTAAINPDHAGTGAVIGAVLPPGLAGLGKVAGWGGGFVNSLVAPFTTKGQERIAGNIINRFAEGGPTAINAVEHVPGSAPTLAEATGNAGIATLQRVGRDLRQNAFVEREVGNAAARNALFDNIAGDATKLGAAKASRKLDATALYDEVLNRQPAPITPEIEKQIASLLKRPSVIDAVEVAKRWAKERGEDAGDMAGSLRALQDVKKAIGDEIKAFTRAGKGGEVEALQGTQAQLLSVMEKMSPGYAKANAEYAAMSKQINAMESLQGLKLTDQMGNIILSKVQSSLSGLQKMRTGPGNNAAKSISAEQIKALEAIRDDLLRQASTGLGRSAGSNTFQNIATDNILSTMIPGKFGAMVNAKAGGIAGQVGKLFYSGPNESIRSRLLDMLLDPQAAKQAMDAAGRPILSGPTASRLRDLSNSAAPTLYRAAPALKSSR